MIHVEYSKVYLAGLAARAKETIAKAVAKLRSCLLRRKAVKAADFWLIEKTSDNYWLLAMPNLQGNREVTAVAQVGGLQGSSDGVLLFKGSKPSLQAITTPHGLLFTEKGPERSKTWSMSYQEVLDVLVCTKFLMANDQLQPGEWFTNREPAYSPRVRASKPPKVAKKRPKKPVKKTAKKRRKRSK